MTNDLDELLSFFAIVCEQATAKIKVDSESIRSLHYRSTPKLNHRTREIIEAMSGPIALGVSDETAGLLSFPFRSSVENAHDVRAIMEAARQETERVVEVLDRESQRLMPEPALKTEQDAQLRVPLTENDRDILAAMLELNATIANPVSSSEILQRALNSDDPKRAFDRLKANALVAAKSRHGRWLTERGMGIANMAQSAP